MKICPWPYRWHYYYIYFFVAQNNLNVLDFDRSPDLKKTRTIIYTGFGRKGNKLCESTVWRFLLGSKKPINHSKTQILYTVS